MSTGQPTCRCGGFLVEGWDRCRFCGTPVGGPTTTDAPGPDGGGPGSDRPLNRSGPGSHGPRRGDGMPPIALLGAAAGIVMLVIVAAAVILGGGGGDQTDLGTGRPAVPAPGAPAPTSAAIESTSTTFPLVATIADFCKGPRTAIPEAKPYDADRGRVHIVFAQAFDGDLPYGWVSALLQTKDAELVLCHDMDAATIVPGPRCDLRESSVTLRMTRPFYDVRLYELHTGTLLAETRLQGPDECPTQVLYNRNAVEGGVLERPSVPTGPEVVGMVTPFVTPA